MAAYKVGYFVGSLATKSINRLLARALVNVAPPELQLTEISFKDLPLYSYDYDSNYPPVAIASTGQAGLMARTRSHANRPP
jgi:chromate reductase